MKISKSIYEAMFKEYPDVVSVAQLGKMLNLSTKTVYKLLDEKVIKSLKPAKSYIIPKVFVIDYLLSENAA